DALVLVRAADGPDALAGAAAPHARGARRFRRGGRRPPRMARRHAELGTQRAAGAASPLQLRLAHAGAVPGARDRAPEERAQARPTARPARDSRRDSRARRSARFPERTLGCDARGGAQRPARRAQVRPRAVLRVGLRRSRLCDLPRCRLPGGGCARAHRPLRQRRSARGVERRAEAPRLTPARRARQARAAARDPAPAAGCADLAGAREPHGVRSRPPARRARGVLRRDVYALRGRPRDLRRPRAHPRSSRAATAGRRDRARRGVPRQRPQVTAHDARRPARALRGRRQCTPEHRAARLRTPQGDRAQRRRSRSRRPRARRSARPHRVGRVPQPAARASGTRSPRSTGAQRPELADGRPDVDHALVLDRHERRADLHDQALDLAEDLVVVGLHGDPELAVRARLEAVLLQELEELVAIRDACCLDVDGHRVSLGLLGSNTCPAGRARNPAGPISDPSIACGPARRQPGMFRFVAVAAGQEHGLFIDGASVEAASGETRELVEPATGEPLARVALAGEADVDRAVAAARAALDGAWGKTPATERSRLLHALADAIVANRKELAELESRNVGKAIASVKAEVAGSAENFRFFASVAGSIAGRSNPVGGSLLTYSLKEPVGVCAQIVPWNYPLLMAVWKLSPALAAGCTVVLKPDPQTPLSVLRVAELAHELGFPPGTI